MSRGKIEAAACILFGAAMTLSMQGYQFGKSNHTVYLIDALRHVRPGVLANDWFTTRTLQYHAVFGWLTRQLMRAGIVQPAFCVGYLALLALLHGAWWRIVRTLGGGSVAFIVSEVLFHLSAGGTGLGMYQFLQDAAFLPSNISAVALLWGIALWLEERPIASGICFGIAGLFHLNYAVVGSLLWVLLHTCKLQSADARQFGRTFWLGSIAAIGPSAVNVLLALKATSHRTAAMPLGEFIELYVRLRHPHHYDPSSWPPWLWLSFLWPMPLAVAMWLRLRREGRITFAWVESARMFVILSLILLVALIGAGIAYTSESLIQASLYRFSVFVKLLSCIAAAFFICGIGRPRTIARCAVAAGAALIALCLWRGPFSGLFRIPQDAPSYLAACDWIRQNTPKNAVFLIPPDEQEFRLRAQRAIVVNFKGVPQLSGELREWRDRMMAVLDMDDLTTLPRPFAATLNAIRQRYDSLPPGRLEAAARRYSARYILADHSFGPDWEARRIPIDANSSWFLYDLSR